MGFLLKTNLTDLAALGFKVGCESVSSGVIFVRHYGTDAGGATLTIAYMSAKSSLRNFSLLEIVDK